MIEIRKIILKRDLGILDRIERIIFPIDYIDKSAWKKYKETYILLYKNIPVGYVTVQPHTGLYSYNTKTHEKKYGTLHLTSLGIIPKFRGKGLAELLILWVLAYAKLGRFKSINATSRKNNKPIISLVKKFGFKISREIKNFYPDGETAVVEEYFFKTHV